MSEPISAVFRNGVMESQWQDDSESRPDVLHPLGAAEISKVLLSGSDHEIEGASDGICVGTGE